MKGTECNHGTLLHHRADSDVFFEPNEMILHNLDIILHVYHQSKVLWIVHELQANIDHQERAQY